MITSFRHLYSGFKTGAFVSSGKPFCIYDRMNFKRDTATYTAAVSAAGFVNVAVPLAVGHRPACLALKVVHVGPYRHLGNAWAMLTRECRHRKLKPRKSVPPFECYCDDPKTTPAMDWVTELFLPLRG